VIILIRSSKYFTYAGIQSKDMHVLNINTESSMQSEPFFASRTLKEVIIRGRKDPFFQQMQYQAISFKMSLCLMDGYFWDEDTIRKVARWLCQDYPQPLIFSDSKSVIYYAICTDSQEIVHNCLRQGIINLTMRCNSPFAYSPDYTTDIIPVTGTQTIKLNNIGDVDCYPEIWIEKTDDSSDQIEIINNTTSDDLIFQAGQKAQGNLTFSGTVYDGETITIGENNNNTSVYEFDTGDGEVSFNRIDVDVSSSSTFAKGELIFNNSYTEDLSTESETITVEGTKATGTFTLNSVPQVNDKVIIGNEIYTFVEGKYYGKVTSNNFKSFNNIIPSQPKYTSLFDINDTEMSKQLKVTSIYNNLYFTLNINDYVNNIFEKAVTINDNIYTLGKQYKTYTTDTNNNITCDYINSSYFKKPNNYSAIVGDKLRITYWDSTEKKYTYFKIVTITNIDNEYVYFSPSIDKIPSLYVEQFHYENTITMEAPGYYYFPSARNIIVSDPDGYYNPSKVTILSQLGSYIYLTSNLVDVEIINVSQLSLTSKQRGSQYNMPTVAYMTDPDSKFTNSKFTNNTLIGGTDDVTTTTNYNKIVQNHSNIVTDGETVSIGVNSDGYTNTYEFDDDGLYSSNSIPVDISGEIDYASSILQLNSNPSYGDTIQLNKQVYTFYNDITDTQLFIPNHGLTSNISINSSILFNLDLTGFLIIYNLNKKIFRLGQVINKDTILQRYFNLNNDGVWIITEQQSEDLGNLGEKYGDEKAIGAVYPIVSIDGQNTKDSFAINKISDNKSFNEIYDGYTKVINLNNSTVDLSNGISSSSGKVIVYYINNLPLNIELFDLIPQINDVLLMIFMESLLVMKPHFYNIMNVKTDITTNTSTENVKITITLDDFIPSEYNATNISNYILLFYSKLKNLTVSPYTFTSSNQIKIGSTKQNTLNNIIDTVNGDTSAVGTEYSVGTITQESTLSATQYYPTNTDDTNIYMKVTALNSGYDANNIITTGSMADSYNKFVTSDLSTNTRTLTGGKSCDSFSASNLLANTINANLDKNSQIQDVEIISNTSSSNLIRLNSNVTIQAIQQVSKIRYNRIIDNYNLSLLDILNTEKKPTIIQNMSYSLLSVSGSIFYFTYFYNDNSVILLTYADNNNIVDNSFIVSTYVPATNTTLYSYVMNDYYISRDDTTKTNVIFTDINNQVKVGDVMRIYMVKYDIINSISQKTAKNIFYVVQSIDSNGVITFDKTVDVLNYKYYFPIFYTKLDTTITTLDNNNSDYRLQVKAKIAGSDGNNILTSANCNSAKWNTIYNNGYTLWGGKDPDMLSCINALKQSINSLYLYKTDYIDIELINLVNTGIKVIGLKQGNIVSIDNIKYLQILNNNHLDFLNFSQYELNNNKIKENTTLFNIGDVFDTYVQYENVNSWGIYSDNKIRYFNSLNQNSYNHLLKVINTNQNINVATSNNIQTLLKTNSIIFILMAKIKDLSTNTNSLLMKDFNLANSGISFNDFLYSLPDAYIDITNTNIELIDVKIFFKIPKTIQITDKNVSRSYSVIDNPNPNVITVQYNEVGSQGNVDVSSTAYNITFDDTTLYGGRSELLMGETVHVDNYRRTITTDQPNISRYNVHNGQFLSLKAGSINTITINGNCNVKFKYTWRFLKE